MLAQQTSNFADLLKSIERYLTTNLKLNQALKDYAGFSIGIDVNAPKFPFLVIYPINEVITRIYSSGIADVSRTIRFESKTLKPKQDTALNQSTGLTNNLKVLFSRKLKDAVWKFTDSKDRTIVFNAKVSEIKIEDPLELPNGIHVVTSIDISFFCQIDLGELSVDYPSQLVEVTNQKEITKIINTVLENNKSFLSEVKQFKYGILEPIHFYPAVATISEFAGTENRFAGVDTYVTSIKIYALTRMINSTEAVYQNLYIIDKIRKIIFANKYIFNRCYDYQIISIDFGISLFDENLVFTSILNLSLKSYDSY